MGVWKVFRNCLEGIWHVSGGYPEGVLRVSGRCLEGVYWCLVGIYGMSEWYVRCLDVSEGPVR